MWTKESLERRLNEYLAGSGRDVMFISAGLLDLKDVNNVISWARDLGYFAKYCANMWIIKISRIPSFVE